MKSVVSIVLLFFFILPVAFFVFLILKGVKNTKADEWDGEVIDKLYNTKRDFDDSHKIEEFYTIVFKTTKGERKIAVNKSDYPTWKIGDKAKKIKGKLGVVRI